MSYILGIDQSTQGTKAILFDEEANPVKRADLAHRQIVNEKGWVSHDPEEIYRNVLRVVREVVEKAGIPKATSGRPPWPGTGPDIPWRTRWCGSAAGRRTLPGGLPARQR